MDEGKASGNGNISLKYAAWLSPALLFVLLVGSVVFYRERMLFIDAPHILFYLINTGSFRIEQHRYGSFISQVLPLAGAKLHLPLFLLMIIYSAGFYLFYLVVCALLVYPLRQYGLAILMGLYFTVLVSATYYWPNNEVHQGITWLLLAFALYFYFLEQGKRLYLLAPTFIISFFLAIWTHPLVIFPAIYLWVFLNFGQRSLRSDKRTLVFSGILFLLCAGKIYMAMHDWYDGNKIETVTHFNISNIKEIIHTPQLHFFLKACLHEYILFTILTITSLAGLLYQRRYLLFIWTILFISGYVALVCITFPDVAPRFYIESEYMPLIIICCAPFVYYVLPALATAKRQWGLFLLVIIYMVRLGYIGYASIPFMHRTTAMARINFIMQKRDLNKVIIIEPAAVDSTLIMNWGAPVESLFMNAMNGEQPQRTFIFLNPKDIKPNDSTMRDTLLCTFERYSTTQLNSYYFQIDTSTGYKIMNYDALMNGAKM